MKLAQSNRPAQSCFCMVSILVVVLLIVDVSLDRLEHEPVRVFVMQTQIILRLVCGSTKHTPHMFTHAHTMLYECKMFARSFVPISCKHSNNFNSYSSLILCRGHVNRA